MGRTRRWRWALCAVGAVLAGGLTPPVAGAEPAAADPGAIVSVEPLPPELSVSGAAVAQRLTYRTEWRSGAPAVGTGVLFVPPGPAPEGGRPVISYAHGTVGIGDDCAPSRNPRADVERAYLEHWLAQGYAVVAADYPGLGTDGVHTYLDGQSAANSVVDIVRAGRAAEPSLSPRWVVVGQSQGGHAALHTAHRASLRAPELDFRGTVTTGAPSNLERLFPFGGPGFPDPGFEGLVAFSSYIFAGLRAAHPDLDVNSYLTPTGREFVDAAERLCYNELDALASDVRVGDLAARPLSEGPFPAVFTDYLGVPTSGYDRPMFLAQGIHDTMVPAPLSAGLAADLLAAGADIDYRVYVAGHNTTMTRSLPDTTPFVARLFAS
ncbi:MULTISPECIES: lipase family protein [Rhodococcus]|uniref:lipase family protein n=1 Tax=Rhodococcus TaxID=1827 RepID=UPI00029AEE53|nr:MULTISPECIES: lipase family protein [Rhodococcus]ATQ27357.1 lipase [Rhodococcus ruber]QRE80747.1 lipase [Rhodococcus ruber]WML64781.1 alpha/beta fold hydrolase [Rhodococcus sp. AH-ZY2]